MAPSTDPEQLTRGIAPILSHLGASPVAQLVKNPPAMWETWVRSPGWENSLQKGKAAHSVFWLVSQSRTQPSDSVQHTIWPNGWVHAILGRRGGSVPPETLFKNAAVNIMHYIIWFTENIIMNRISGT